MANVASDPFQNKTALITGASSGIGEEFARQLAARGMHLALCARSGDKLETLAAQMIKEHGIRAQVITADLSDPDAARALPSRVDGDIDLIINNAGFGTHGAFVKQDADNERREVLLNALAPLEVIHAAVPGMRARGGGAIINVASSAGFQATPYMSVYGATKAFLLHLSEGLWAELDVDNIHVMALCPGPVKTNFFDASGSASLKKAVDKTPLMDVSRCVRIAIKDFERGKPVSVPGVSMKLSSQASRIMPRSMLTKVSARLLGPRHRKTAK